MYIPHSPPPSHAPPYDPRTAQGLTVAEGDFLSDPCKRGWTKHDPFKPCVAQRRFPWSNLLQDCRHRLKKNYVLVILYRNWNLLEKRLTVKWQCEDLMLQLGHARDVWSS